MFFLFRLLRTLFTSQITRAKTVTGNMTRPHGEARGGAGAAGTGGRGTGSVGKGSCGDGAGAGFEPPCCSVGEPRVDFSADEAGPLDCGAGSVGSGARTSVGISRSVNTITPKNPTINADATAAMASHRLRNRCPNPTNSRKSTH